MEFSPNFLQQVQGSSKPHETSVGLSLRHNNAGSDKTLQDSVTAQLSVRRGNPGRRSQEVRTTKGKTKLEHSKAFAPDPASGDLHRRFCSSLGGAAAWPWWEATSLRRQGSSKLQASLQQSRARRQAAETNVDTGLAVGTAAGGCCALGRFHKDLRSSLLQPRSGAGSTLPSRGCAQRLQAAARWDKNTRQRASSCHSQAQSTSPDNGAEDDEEEFFI